MNMPPLTLRILIECALNDEPSQSMDHKTWISDPAKLARIWLIGHGLIDDQNRATDKGAAMVRSVYSNGHAKRRAA